MMFDFIVKAEALGAVPKTSTVKSIPLDNNLLVAVFLAVFFTAMFLNLILPPCTSPFTLYEEAGSANTPICFALDLKFLVYTTYCVEFAMVFSSFLIEGKSVLNIPVSILFPFPWFVLYGYVTLEFQSLLSYVPCLQLYTRKCKRSTAAERSTFLGLIVLVVRHREQVYALVQQFVGLFLGGVAVELLVTFALVCLPGLPGEVLTNVLVILLDLLVEFTQYLFRGLSHHEVVVWYLFLLGGLDGGSHYGLVHRGAVAHGTVYQPLVLLSLVFFAVWEPTLELVLASTSQLIFDHNNIYIIYLT